MDFLGFYKGEWVKAYEYMGARLCDGGVMFRVYAPSARRVQLIGDFSDWNCYEMNRANGKFFECFVANAKVGDRYKYKITGKDGKEVDHADPYGYGMELRPGSASIIRDLYSYKFGDDEWMNSRTDCKDKPLNIYEVHLGSWLALDGEMEGGFHNYREIADDLIKYVKANGYNYIEIMPICEYPCDESWGYQALGFFAPTSRYGELDDLKYLVDSCHKENIGVILDYAPVHFAVDYYGLAMFDGDALFEYPHNDVGFNEWGSKNFAHYRGEIQSFLKSSMYYWLAEYHFDGIRIDAVRNMIYWQGNENRGVNNGTINFLKSANAVLKSCFPTAMLIAEDSSSYPGVTKPVNEGGLGFDYKWDMGWMNDTLNYFRSPADEKQNSYHRLTFSMMYYYSERFILPFSHDEVVHGKATILQKMSGEYEEKFPLARALYMYMYAHPGKKLNFMGNEIGQLREWDEKREPDWDILKYPNHDSFNKFMKKLNEIYLNSPALYQQDYTWDGFQWLDCTAEHKCVYSFVRYSAEQAILAVFNFSDIDCKGYEIAANGKATAKLILDSGRDIYGGSRKMRTTPYKVSKDGKFKINIEKLSAKFFLLK